MLCHRQEHKDEFTICELGILVGHSPHESITKSENCISDIEEIDFVEEEDDEKGAMSFMDAFSDIAPCKLESDRDAQYYIPYDRSSVNTNADTLFHAPSTDVASQDRCCM